VKLNKILLVILMICVMGSLALGNSFSLKAATAYWAYGLDFLPPGYNLYELSFSFQVGKFSFGPYLIPGKGYGEMGCYIGYPVQASEKINQIGREQVVGKRLLEVFPGIKDFGLFEVFQRVWRTGKAEYFPATLYQDERISGWRENHVYKLPSGEVVAVYDDVTERKQHEQTLQRSEKQYRSLFEDATDMIHIIDTQGRIVDANKQELARMGYSKEDYVGRPLLDFIHPDYRDITAKPLQYILQGKEITSFATAFLTRQGEKIYVAVNATPLVEAGQIKFVRAICHDVTERLQHEQKIHRLNQEMEQRIIQRTTELSAANEELEAYTYSVSHDLRAPLRSLDGYTQAIEEDYASEMDQQGRQYLRYIRESTAELNQLIDGLLVLSRDTRGELIYDFIDLSAMAHDIIEELRENYTQRDVSIRVDSDLSAHGDPRLIRVLMHNLLENAWKFSQHEQATRIEFHRLQTAAGLAFVVSDNGIGFDMHNSHRLFQPFQRLHKEKELGGSGIGLATARRIVVRHGGKIWAESEPGKGARFYFTLP